MKVNKFFYIPLYLILLTTILYFIQNMVIGSLKDTYDFYYSVSKIYIFHFTITFIILSVLYLISKKAPQFIGYTFMGFILFKMIATVVFLIPLIKLEGISKIPDFISFFAPYFVYLFFEIMITLALLKRSDT